MKAYRYLLLLLLILVPFIGCDDTTEEDADCEEAPFFCEEIEPDEGDITISTSDGQVRIWLYEGEITSSNEDDYTEYLVTDGKLTIEDMPVGRYSVMAFYYVDGKTVTAVASDVITVDSEDYCDWVTCYEVEDAKIDVTFEEEAFEEFLANEEDACFIATAAYGSKYEEHVVKLRHFRDTRLLTNRPGRLFVKAYYTVSPPVAHLIARSPLLKQGVRAMLDPLVELVGE